MNLFFFFFQAEDGIRYRTVTGVQTCALPIYGDDLVIGSRFRGRIHRGAMPAAHRWIGNPLLTKILNVFFDIQVSDAHCGLRAIRRTAVPLLELQTTGMEFASEMILKAAKRNLRVGETPIEYHPRVGESKLNTFRDGWRHL